MTVLTLPRARAGLLASVLGGGSIAFFLGVGCSPSTGDVPPGEVANGSTTSIGARPPNGGAGNAMGARGPIGGQPPAGGGVPSMGGNPPSGGGAPPIGGSGEGGGFVPPSTGGVPVGEGCNMQVVDPNTLPAC